MKKVLIIFAAIIMMAAVSTNLMAQPNTVSTNASANIVVPLTITKTADLCFGTMTSPTGGSTVLLQPNGNISVTYNGGNMVLLSQTPTPSVAGYTVTGQTNTYYNIYLPASVTITNPSSNTMTIDGWLTSENNNGTVGFLDGNGHDAFTLGGTLHVGGYQALGLYTGTFNVTVNYN